MKKILVVLMFIVRIVSFSDYYVISSGYDRMTDIDTEYPGITILQDSKDNKYDIYRFTYSHGCWVEEGTTMTKDELINASIFNMKLHKVLVHKGKKCINLTKLQLSDILNDIDYKEAKDNY